MLTIFLKTIKDRALSLVIYILASIGFTWMYVALFPSFQDQAGQFDKFMQTFPEGFMEAFGFEGGMFFASIENFLATEMFSFVWPILVIAIGVGIAGGAIAGQIEKNTIETLLAQPLSRTKIFFAKYLAGVFNLIVFVFVSIYSIIPLAMIYNVDYQLKRYLPLALIGLFFAWAIYGLAFLVSSLVSKKGLVNFITVGVVVLMYVVNIIANLKESLENLKYLSFFHYFDTNQIFAKGEVDNFSYWALIGSIIIVSLVSWYIFYRRDIST